MSGREINIFDRKKSIQRNDKKNRFQLMVPVVSDENLDPALRSDYNSLIWQIIKIKERISEFPTSIQRFTSFYRKSLDKKLRIYVKLYKGLLEKLDQHYQKRDFNYLEKGKIAKWILEICADLEEKGFPASAIEQKYERIQEDKANEKVSNDLIDLELLDLNINNKEEKEALKRSSMVAEKNPASKNTGLQFDQINSELEFLFRRNLSTVKDPGYQHFLREKLEQAERSRDFHQLMSIKFSAVNFYYDKAVKLTNEDLGNFTVILDLQLKELHNQYCGIIDHSIFANHLEVDQEIDQQFFKELLYKHEEFLNIKLKEVRSELQSIQSIKSTRILLGKIEFHLEDNDDLVDIFK